MVVFRSNEAMLSLLGNYERSGRTGFLRLALYAYYPEDKIACSSEVIITKVP
jgi:hypothetical protein